MIEQPTPKDVPAIEQIAVGTGAFNTVEVGIVREMLDAFFHPEPRDDHTFVIYRNGNADSVAGFACYGPAPMTDRVWDLYWICVDSSKQKTGIGSQLLQYVEQQVCAQGARALYLETSDTEVYRAARAFYVRNGYECIAQMDDFYAPGDGKVVFRKVFRRD